MPAPFRLAAALALLAPLATGCGGPAEAVSPAHGLPPYTPEEARLFDDGLASELFGYGLDSRRTEADPLTADRAARADTVTVMKVTTLSREGSGATYSLSLRPLRVVAGPAETAPVTLTVTPASPSFPLLDGVGGAWVGTELVLLARRYRQGDEAVIHFRAEPARPEVVAMIARARSSK
jgi:hypothetical protein